MPRRGAQGPWVRGYCSQLLLPLDCLDFFHLCWDHPGRLASGSKTRCPEKNDYWFRSGGSCSMRKGFGAEAFEWHWMYALGRAISSPCLLQVPRSWIWV